MTERAITIVTVKGGEMIGHSVVVYDAVELTGVFKEEFGMRRQFCSA
jgi:hypothetical protein